MSTSFVPLSAFVKGIKAEKKVEAYFCRQHFSCLARRYKTLYGEIDLIVSKGDSIRFVEVKNRKTWQEGLFSLSPRQLKRIFNAADFFLQEHPQTWQEVQVDLVVVSPEGLYHVCALSLDG